LGGVRDEAEIRGHRRTYVGALPGRVIQSIHKVGVSNPVFLLDEIDKMGADFRGDPSAALLEVLDPEQNKTFSDHYMEVDFDLSDVFFITTANTQDPIPRPLRDRMEIIEMSGYTEAEKVGIMRDHLIPKELIQHGLSREAVVFEDAALRKIVQEYTREAGVRNLERTIATVLRKVAVSQVKGEKKDSVTVNLDTLQEYLGAPKYRFGIKEETDSVGSATGLVWTEVGGDTIPIEVTVMKGRGSFTLTGQLGEVMQESAKAAMSFVRSRAGMLGLDENFYRKVDLHIHVPEGAVPKDGPSAGITIATALSSALTGIPVRRDVAMTGEITLRGKVLPIGGLKEKLLAARRAGMCLVIMPDENRRDFDELKSEITEGMEFHFVKEMDEVLPLALTKPLPSASSSSDKPRTNPPETPGEMQDNAFA
jgi:ATP-dependent Lon protease